MRDVGHGINANTVSRLQLANEVDEEGVNVRRTTEVREPKSVNERSVYAASIRSFESFLLQFWGVSCRCAAVDLVLNQYCPFQKGFGDETDDMQTKLEEFFHKYGYVNAARMRRDDTKAFKVRLRSTPCPQHPHYLLQCVEVGGWWGKC